MATTGAPWNIPYVEPTDIPRTYPDDSEDLALAVAAGLSAAGGLVAVKHVLKTDVFSASVAGQGNVAVTGLSITHALADASNKLIISAYFGASGGSTEPGGRVGLAIHDGTNLIAIGADSDLGNRTRVGSGGTTAGATTEAVMMPSVTFVHEPGDTSSRTYTVRAINIQDTTRTVSVNRNAADLNNQFNSRASSAFVIQEVKV